MAARREQTARAKLLDQAWVEQFVNARVEHLIGSVGNDADVFRMGMRICKQLIHFADHADPDATVPAECAGRFATWSAFLGACRLPILISPSRSLSPHGHPLETFAVSNR